MTWLLTHTKKKIKLIFPAVLQIFDLECHQTSFKVPFVIFGLVFMKYKQLKCLPPRKQVT